MLSTVLSSAKFQWDYNMKYETVERDSVVTMQCDNVLSLNGPKTILALMLESE